MIDLYGPDVVVEALSQGMDRLLSSVTDWLYELLSHAGILARYDPKVRALEGLEQVLEVLACSVPETVVPDSFRSSDEVLRHARTGPAIGGVARNQEPPIPSGCAWTCV